MTPPNRELVQLMQRPDHVPVWRAGIVMVAVALVGDLLTPVHTPFSVGLVIMPPASLIARSERLTARLTVLSVVSSAAAGLYDSLRSGIDPDVVLLRLGVVMLVLLSGVWATWQASRAGGGAPDAPVERAPTTALEEPAQPTERAARTLAHLAGAPGHRLHQVEDAAAWIARQPLAAPTARARRAGLRVPASRLPLASPPEPDRVWRAADGNVYVRFAAPGQSETVVELSRPSAPLPFITDAAQVLQMQLERATLFEQVRVQRELLRDLVYAFSHDLRTPITANILHAEAALSGAYGPLSPELALFLQHSQQGNRDLLTVSDQLMLLAEYESGDLTGGPVSTVELEDMIRSVVGDVQVRGRERGVHFELHLQPCSVHGHAYDLRRAVQNLLENAVKFSPEQRAVLVHLRAEKASAVIEVMDQGSGVPDTQLPHLFRRFRTSTRGSGTGFGLYLARRIVERYGGTLTYERSVSDPPWTTFRLCLPLNRD